MPRPRSDSTVDPRIAFVAIAERRTSTAIKALANVAKLPHRHMRPSDVTAITAALEGALRSVKSRMESAEAEAPTFKLGS